MKLSDNENYYGTDESGNMIIKNGDYRQDSLIPAFVKLPKGKYYISTSNLTSVKFKLINKTTGKIICYSSNTEFNLSDNTEIGMKC